MDMGLSKPPARQIVLSHRRKPDVQILDREPMIEASAGASQRETSRIQCVLRPSVLRCATIIACVFVLCLLAQGATTWRQTRLDQILVEGVEHRDLLAVLAALRHGANPNARHTYQNRITSAKDVVDWVLRKETIFWHDCPVLMEACGAKELPILRVLLEHGADPNRRSSSGNTPLLDCIEQDNPAVVRLLLAHGADPNLRNDGGETALVKLRGNRLSTKRCVPLLVRYGASPGQGEGLLPEPLRD